MLEVSGIRLSLDAALPENAEMRTKEVARALGVSERLALIHISEPTRPSP